MTLPQEWSEGQEYGYGATEPNVAEAEFPAVVPVRVVMTESENLPPGFASCTTWPIGQTGINAPTQILQRRMHRYKAKMVISVPGACTVTLNTKQEPLTNPTPQGITLVFTAANNNPGYVLQEYDAMPPLFAIASIAGVTIAVLDESFGQVQ